MESYQGRLATFKDWSKKYRSQKLGLFVVAGFFCVPAEQEDNTTCVFCSKSLEGWEEKDVPVEEHYLHNTKCPLFNLDNYMSRKRTFEVCDIRAFDYAILAKSAFFLFPLKESARDVFCFKCGFSLDLFADDVYTRAQKHFGQCPKKHLKTLSFSMDNPNGVFYIDLLQGKYNENIRRYVDARNQDVEFGKDLVDKLSEHIGGNQLVSVEEALLESLETATANLEKYIDNDIKRALRNFDANARKYRHA